ncbi:MAG: Gx transporter family protein [Thermodesulfovibrionales bacterium]
MQLPDKHRIAVLSAYALALHGLESLIPSPIPWLKIGLANLISLVALVLYGFRPALMVTLVRIVLGSIFTGTFLGPGFLLSLGGGLASVSAMGLCHRIFPRLFGPIGLSLISALFHNLAQLGLAWLLFIQRIEAVLLVAPVLILIGTVSGAVTGMTADVLIRSVLQKNVQTQHNVAS